MPEGGARWAPRASGFLGVGGILGPGHWPARHVPDSGPQRSGRRPWQVVPPVPQGPTGPQSCVRCVHEDHALTTDRGAVLGAPDPSRLPPPAPSPPPGACQGGPRRLLTPASPSLQRPRVMRSSSRRWRRPGSPRATTWWSPSAPTAASTSPCSATCPPATAGACWWTPAAPCPARPPGEAAAGGGEPRAHGSTTPRPRPGLPCRALQGKLSRAVAGDGPCEGQRPWVAGGHVCAGGQGGAPRVSGQVVESDPVALLPSSQVRAAEVRPHGPGAPDQGAGPVQGPPAPR